MSPGVNSPSSPLYGILGETPKGCLVNVATPALAIPAAALSLCAAPGPPSRSTPSTPPDVSEGGSNPGGASSALPGRRRRTQDDPTEQTSPAAMDVIGRFKMIISIVESTSGASSTPRPEVGELLKAVQRLKLPAGKSLCPYQKRRRRPTGSSETLAAASRGQQPSVSLLQETIAAIEQMRLSEPMEKSEEYAEVLGKLKELLRTEKVDDG